MITKLKNIGRKLKEYRIQNNISPDELAKMLSVSRAAVYRIENGEIIKVETLDNIAKLFNQPFSSLLGMGAQYCDDAYSYFLKMMELEEQSEQVVAYFPPFSFLLTSPNYTKALRETLIQNLPPYADSDSECDYIQKTIEVLEERKKTQKHRRFSIINFISAFEIERWLALSKLDLLPPYSSTALNNSAPQEVKHLISYIKDRPMGVQIALTKEIMPSAAFQLFRSGSQNILALSPYRLGGDLPNIHTGVGMFTSDAEIINRYERMTDIVWDNSLKGNDAISYLEEMLDKSSKYSKIV